MNRKLFFLFIGIGIVLGCHAQTFNHPGLLHNGEALQRIRKLVAEESQPALGSYNILKNLPEASAGYCIKGPFTTISRGGKYGYTKDPCERDFNAAYYNALQWIITGKTAHAGKSLEIIRSYSRTLQSIDKPDDPLCAGLQGFMLVNAAEIIRYTYTAGTYENGWSEQDTQQTENMFRTAFLPVLDTFYETPPYTNGNWGIAVTKAYLAMAIFMNNRDMYNKAIDFFYNGKDNGSLPNYVSATGQLQESGRDQQHCMLGLGCLAEIAEMAWNQGDDLYSAFDNRIMKGYEYLSKSNLGYEVPFSTWKDITGKYSNWHSIGQDGLGRFRSVFEIGYNHYVERMKMEMPYTQAVLGRVRPEGPGFTCDNPGFGTLLFYTGNNTALHSEDGRINEQLENLHNWVFATAGFTPVQGKMSFTPSGLKMSKRGIRYDAGQYPVIAVKAPSIPSVANPNWLQFSHSVMSAPEFWELAPQSTTGKNNDIYLFRIPENRSNNGTPFPLRISNVTLILDFGETHGEPVQIEWIRSFHTLEEIKEYERH